MSAGVDPRLDEVLEACLDALERDGPSALEAACSAHPELAERLRRRVGLLAAANLIDFGPTLDRLPARMGDFEPLDRIGAGGMGVVHRARQTSTGRLVALKLVRPEQLFFAESRARFRREVELSARLHHPAVLDVLAVGETEGLPWFALELVHGTSLAALLAELRSRCASPAEIEPARLPQDLVELTPAALREGPTCGPPSSWREWALRVAREVADALAYAHKKGVLHRDVKPSNVLLATDGRVFLTDFGLASHPDEASLTRSNFAVGSLPYMSPEVLAGEPGDVQSDVYGVGALLYELLTLHRPFEAESTASLVREIAAGDLVPPRRHASDLGPDDQAVVLRALEREPRNRYANADELVADLDCLLAHLPTRARPLGPFARVARAARRRPAIALAVGLGIVALLAGPSGWAASRMRALNDIKRAYGAELAARERAERHFRAALAAIGHVLRDTATDELDDVPRLQVARLVAVERALELVAELERDRPGDPAVRGERAALHTARAEVLYDQGRIDEALAECAQAEEIQRVLGERERLRETTSLAAKLLEASLRWEEALPIQRELVAELRAEAEATGAVETRRQLAFCLANLAACRRQVEGPAAALADLVEGGAIARELRGLEPEDPDVVWTVGRLAQDEAEVHLAMGDGDAAQACASDALEAMRTAAELEPSARFYRSELAIAMSTRAKVGSMNGEDTEALYRDALSLFVELSTDFPESVRYRLERARVLDELALSLRHTRPKVSPPLHEEAIALSTSMVAIHPERCQIRLLAATTLNNWANHLIHVQRRWDEAASVCERSAALLEPCVQGAGALTDVGRLRAMTTYLYATALCLDDEAARALPEIETFESLAGDEAWRWRYSADLWNEWLLALERNPSALESAGVSEPDPRRRMFDALRRAIELGYRNVDELRTTPALQTFLSDPEFIELLRPLTGR